jgi:hypothetical protein
VPELSHVAFCLQYSIAESYVYPESQLYVGAYWHLSTEVFSMPPDGQVALAIHRLPDFVYPEGHVLVHATLCEQLLLQVERAE